MTLPSGGGQATAGVRVVTDFSDALTELEAFQAQVKAGKEDLQSLVDVAKANPDLGLSLDALISKYKELSSTVSSSAQQKEAINQFKQSIDNSTQSTMTAEQAAQKFRDTLVLIRQEAEMLRSKGFSFEEISAALKQVGNNATQVNQVIKQMRVESQQSSLATTKSFQDTKQAAEFFRREVTLVIEEINKLKEAGYNLREIEGALRATGQFDSRAISAGIAQANTGVKGLITSFTSLQGVAGALFGGVLGGIALGAINKLKQAFMELTEEGENYSRAILKMEVAARAMQRQGMEVYISTLKDDVRSLREQFSVFSEREAIDAVGTIALATRELNLTHEQMVQVQEASAALGLLWGRDLAESARQISLAISSGYSEALQKAGLNINRVVIGQKAMAMGFGDNFNALTGQAKATATLTLINEQLADTYGDIIKFSKETIGVISQAESRYADLRAEIGLRLLPIKAAFAKILINIIEGLRGIANIISLGVAYALADLSAGFIMVGEAAELFWKKVTGGEGSEETWQEFADRMTEMNEELRTQARELFFPDITGIFGDLDKLGKGIDLSETEVAILEAFDKLRQAVEEEQRKFAERIKELETDLMNDLAEIDRRGLAKNQEIWRDYWYEFDSLTRKLRDDQAKAARKFQYDMSKIEGDYLDKVAKAREDWRDKEREAEIKFINEMRKLRDQLIFDLGEAVRTRDASQIRSLLMKYNFDKDQLIKDREDEKSARERDLQDQLEDLRRERDQRLKERQITYAQELRELQIADTNARNEAAIQRDIALAELEIDLQEQRDARNLKYQQDIEDAKIASQNRVNEIAIGMAEELKITAEMAELIYQKLNEYFGENGYVDALYQAMSARIIETLTRLSQATQTFLNNPGQPADVHDTSVTPNYTPSPPPSVGDQAEGGSYIANQPTIARFGEAGGEIATFIPLNKTADLFNSLSGNGGLGVPGTDGKDGEQKIILEVLLSPDLAVGMMDQISEGLADLIVGVTNSRR